MGKTWHCGEVWALKISIENDHQKFQVPKMQVALYSAILGLSFPFQGFPLRLTAYIGEDSFILDTAG